MVKPTKVGKEQRLPNFDELLRAAQASRTRAYVPYSKYAVGAAVLGSDGKIYSGCNVENASYGLTICAERNAIAAMVAAGCTSIEAVAVVTADGGTPCGACRQVLSEFAVGETTVVCAGDTSSHQFSVAELLPSSFKLS